MKPEINKSITRRYIANESGQFGVVFALLAIPLLLITTLAIDHRQAESERKKLSSALDHTALAAVIDQTLTEEERKDFAKRYFEKSFVSNNKTEFTVVDSSAERVELTASTNVPTTIGGITGLNDITISDTVVGELTKGDVVCMLALDPDNERSFEVSHGAHFSAETCSVQVNSKHARASIIDHGGVAEAKDFCIKGGAVGNYKPYANSQCSAVDDPYFYRRIPGPGTCKNPLETDNLLNSWQAEEYFGWSGGYAPGVTLLPGTYCGGLELRGKNVRFAPGEYIIKDGPLFFDFGTRATGDGVTFIFSGSDAVLKINEGSSISLTAPKRGALAGLVFAQDRVTQHGKDAALPSGETIIRSGGNLEITGTAYLPTQKISFIGGSISEAQAPATSFIGYQISISDGAKISVAVDHQKAGLPPILPRSDEGARLSQ